MGQNVVHVTCSCGHVGTIREPETVTYIMKAERGVARQLRCTKCHEMGRGQITIAWEAAGNPMKGAAVFEDGQNKRLSEGISGRENPTLR